MAQRTVKAKEIVQDIRSGMDRAALMEKHHISAGELAQLLKKLVELRALAPSEVEGIEPQAGGTALPCFRVSRVRHNGCCRFGRMSTLRGDSREDRSRDDGRGNCSP